MGGTEPETRNCQHCGTAFTVITPQAKRLKKYCSDACRMEAHTERTGRNFNAFITPTLSLFEGHEEAKK